MEKYMKDGNVAILISPGFGAGWSTWEGDSLAYDKRVVEFFLNCDDETKKKIAVLDSKENKKATKLFKSWGYDDVYFGGFEDIVIKWLPEGTKYMITQYDGSETLKTIEDIGWQTA